MSCAKCVAKLTSILEGLDGVASVGVSLEDAAATVSYESNLCSDTLIRAAIRGGSFGVGSSSSQS
ncbi:MAG TPA: heavy-metal-associated domain-containing protein, partial [Geopsychrobacteraceae bacterium]|nr:heavy-metal-associated domain-containing protein [Geopsychrobacteraceae bacterium]